MKSIEILCLCVCDDEHVFDTYSAITSSIQPRFDRKDFAFQERTTPMIQQDGLMQFEPYAMACAMLA